MSFLFISSKFKSFKGKNFSIIAKSVIRAFNNGETNKMLIGLTLASNNNSFVGCAPAWVTDRWYNERYDPNYKSPVGKCYNFDRRGVATNSFEPLDPTHRRSTDKTQNGRPYHSHQMAGFSTAFLSVIHNKRHFLINFFFRSSHKLKLIFNVGLG